MLDPILFWKLLRYKVLGAIREKDHIVKTIGRKIWRKTTIRFVFQKYFLDWRIPYNLEVWENWRQRKQWGSDCWNTSKEFWGPRRRQWEAGNRLTTMKTILLTYMSTNWWWKIKESSQEVTWVDFGDFGWTMEPFAIRNIEWASLRRGKIILFWSDKIWSAFVTSEWGCLVGQGRKLELEIKAESSKCVYYIWNHGQ